MTTRQFFSPGFSAGKSQAQILVAQQLQTGAKRKLLERMREDLLTAWPEDSYLLVSDFKEAIDRYLQEIEEGHVIPPQTENATLKDTIDCQEEDIAILRRELEEAREAAAGADVFATARDNEARAWKDTAEQRLAKIRKLKQQVQTQGNTIANQDDMIERMRVRVQGADRCNENQRQLIQTLRENSATALIQALKDNMAEVEKYQTKVSFDHLRQILDAYERRIDG